MTSKLAVALLAMIPLSASLHVVPFSKLDPPRHCQCDGTHSAPFHPKSIKELKVMESTPFCHKRQIIVKLENELWICLDPHAKWVQKVVQIFLERAEKKKP